MNSNSTDNDDNNSQSFLTINNSFNKQTRSSLNAHKLAKYMKHKGKEVLEARETASGQYEQVVVAGNQFSSASQANIKVF